LKQIFEEGGFGARHVAVGATREDMVSGAAVHTPVEADDKGAGVASGRANVTSFLLLFGER
jgi:hypothetical protein